MPLERHQIEQDSQHALVVLGRNGGDGDASIARGRQIECILRSVMLLEIAGHGDSLNGPRSKRQ
jgi:hypothetical protein